MGDTSFLKLIPGSSRIVARMGLKMDEGVPMKVAGHGYLALEIPAVAIRNPSDLPRTEKALRNQHVQIIPGCSLEVRGNEIVEIEPCPELAEYGSVQAGYYILPDDKAKRIVPAFWITLRKDLDLSDIPYAIRIYLRA